MTLNVILFFTLIHAPRGQFHIWISPGGNGILLLAPSARAMLVDGYPDAQTLSPWVGKHLPPFIGRLDTAMISVPDENMVEAQVAVFQHNPPREGFRLPWTRDPRTLAAWEHAVATVRILDAGDGQLWEGGVVRVLATTPPVVAFQVGTFKWLYMPRGCDRDTHVDAQMWVLKSWAHCENRTLPHWVVGREVQDTSVASTLLASPTTRVYLGQEVHIITDGIHYRWEVK